MNETQVKMFNYGKNLSCLVQIIIFGGLKVVFLLTA